MRPSDVIEEPTTPVICRREKYEVHICERTYCSRIDLECQYRSKIDDDHGYRCMMLEKMI